MKTIFVAFDHLDGLGAILILLLLAYVAILILQLAKSKDTLIVSLVLGLLIGVIYLVFTSGLEYQDPNLPGYNYEGSNQQLVDSIYIWLTMAWNIFMIMLLAVLPLYIFSMVSTTFTNARHHEGGKRLLRISFFALWGMTLLGIVIAILLFPLMELLKEPMQLPDSMLGTHDNVGIFGGIWPAFEDVLDDILVNYGYIVITMIILAIIFAIVMNLLHTHLHDHGEKVISFIEHMKEAIRKYLTWVTKLVPYVISGMLVVLFANYNNVFTDTLGALSVFVMFFFIGLFIVWGIEYSIVTFGRNSKEEISKKEWRKLTAEYAINDFSVQSAPVLFPITVAYVHKTGVSDAVLETTPTLSTFMGYSMCGGFYPALIVLFTLLQDQPFTIDRAMNLTVILITISVMIPMILIMTLGMTGVPGADVAIVLGLLSALGLNPAYFFTIYLIEPLLDKCRGVGNSMGFAAASVITDKIYEKENFIEKADKELDRVYQEYKNNK